jgi:quinol monooxygenase YgiN
LIQINNSVVVQLAQELLFKLKEASDMFSYLIKVDIKLYKSNEFITNFKSIAPRIRMKKGCIEYRLYSNCDEERVYTVMGEWKTKEAMENHFQTRDFQVFVGAARVLGETFEMKILKGLETGGIGLAKARIAPKNNIK